MQYYQSPLLTHAPSIRYFKASAHSQVQFLFGTYHRHTLTQAHARIWWCILLEAMYDDDGDTCLSEEESAGIYYF